MAAPPTPISTLLVANRGEIALRVIRAARALGIRTVAVYSDADAAAPHVRAADVATRIGPAPAAQSYLDTVALLAAARRTGADAVHPGYGFLSERASFARAVVGAGLIFVGPTPDVIDLMGRKDAARAVAVAAGVPVVPGVDLDVISADPTSAPYPLLIKAAAGGGGLGMRVVDRPEELASAVAAARREARAAFGDDTVLVEQYVEAGRHVEVQILGDLHGTLVHLADRDCSSQRRRQKIIEEAPAPGLSTLVRDRLRGSALALAKRVGYTNAGTVEFLVRGSDVFFLEMNTRLQVEHPVTELITGVDLVQLQLRIAAGERLPFGQADVTVTGHAIEARICAEDAFAGFLPQAGTADLVRWPAGARVDAALASGDVVSTHYDPLLGKIIVHGATREAARAALVAALDDTAILGLTTNAGFVRALAASEPFRDGEVHTGWLAHHADSIRPADTDTAAVIAAWTIAGGTIVGVTAAGPPAHPFATADGWRLAGPPAPTLVELAMAGGHTMFRVDRTHGTVSTHDRRWQLGAGCLEGQCAEGGLVRVQIDGSLHQAVVRVGRDHVDVAHLGQTITFDRPAATSGRATGAAPGGTVVAPMPGTVVAVSVGVGGHVGAGDVLGVLEAMKLQITLQAPVTGTVTAVVVAVGDTVTLGETLFVVDAAPA